ncbi:TonB-dependent receptor [Xanthomonas populi]
MSVATLLSAQAYAQDAPPTAAPAQDPTTQQLDTVQVTGTRSSVTKAQLVKQNAEQIVDSIVAEDIGKLPDNNVAEALQRISGIQITRNYGEGSSIAIRGLTQVRTELNGRINAQTEKTYAAYGVLRFGVDSDSIPFDGNIGVRVVRTEVGSTGVRTGTDGEGGGLIPVDAQQTYTDVLPSLNLRWMLSDTLQWRFAASRGISRPTFDRLNPNLSLGTNSGAGGSTLIGSAGNPELEPVKADQFDTALEWYFGQGSMMYSTLFYKKVEGFIANAVFNEIYDGQLAQITRPVNGDAGKIRGAELGYTQFFDFLPGCLSGFGLQTNYTYVDSEAPSPTATDTNGQALTVPLEGLSKNSYNAILSYETARFQGRVAYNWRSDWLVTTAGNGTGNLPVYNKGFGQLDASLRFNINAVWSISLDGVNLLDTRRESYLGSESRYRDFVINDRRYGLTLRASL